MAEFALVWFKVKILLWFSMIETILFFLQHILLVRRNPGNVQKFDMSSFATQINMQQLKWDSSAHTL